MARFELKIYLKIQPGRLPACLLARKGRGILGRPIMRSGNALQEDQTHFD